MQTYRGHLFHVTGSPRVSDARAHLISEVDGALVVDDEGVIAYSGSFTGLPEQWSTVPVVDHRPGFLLPGFVDAHIHFPQTFAVNAYGGGQLLEWLEHCVFPSESMLDEPGFARKVAKAFCRKRISVGTTSAMVFGSAFPHAQDALFEETKRVGLRMVSGRGIQTIGPPSASALITSEKDALDLTAAEIDKWHAADTGDDATALLHVAVVPRFSLSVTRETLGALGELYEDVRNRGVYFHSHLNENNRPATGEVAAVRDSYEVDSYLDTYDGKFLAGSKTGGKSMLGRRSILAHAVHCQDSELARMAETGTSIAHCPTSQLFLGSGTMPWLRTVDAGVNIAMGSDVGAGDEWMISRVLNDTFKVHISETGDSGTALDPATLLFTGTLAGARALDIESRTGNLDAGKEADFLVVEPALQPSLENLMTRAVRADNTDMATDQVLFALIMAMREEAIAKVFVKGRELHA
ncbi:guanine deaminase [Rhodococcus erythropolis]|uniref:Guanine deaminase n=1 Tax=Rhodococcus erythropolis TaxID=1833 RepID=A0A8I1A0L2_RHOER|nr:guanine deaminase [Rhodococcus erythropolis]MBH5146497.1 guanine deaminase [Rhodococcus erythropolis]